MIRYLFDTNIVSAFMRDPLGRVGQRIGLSPTDEMCTSIVVAAELRFGAARRESASLNRQIDLVLSRLAVVAWDAPADRAYADLRAALERRGTPIGANDMLIAAHALSLDCILVTDNEDEFRRVPGLQVDNWIRG